MRQTSFAAGEIDPLRWSRTDQPWYAHGCRTLRNFFPSRQGAAVSRPGTTYVDGVKNVDAPSLGVDRDTGQARLIRFDVADDDSYGLEFGNRYIRFIRSGGRVLDALGNAYEVATPYSNTDIWELQVAQLGDVLIICSPNWDPYQLRRKGHTTWTFERVRFKAYEPFATDVGNPSQPTTGFSLVKSVEVLPGPPITWGFHTEDADHPAREWQWLWTAIVKDKETGVVYETLGELVSEAIDDSITGDYDYDGTHELLTSDSHPVYIDMPIKLARAETAGLLTEPDGADTYEVLEYVIYRGRGGVFGWVGSTKGREFLDVGEEPDYSIQPPQGTSPFGEETEATGLAAPFDTRHLDRPAAVTFFQGRLVFAGLTRQPGDFYASRVNDFFNFDARLYKHVADEAVHFELAYRRREQLRSAVVLDKLLLLSSSSVWSVDGGQGQPLLFDHVETHVEEEIGATRLPPLVVAGGLLYARAKGRGVRGLVTQGQATPLAGVDVSELALHLFTGKDRTLVDWCYQEDPWGLVWAVREDGQLLSLTFGPNQRAWARHDTDGVVESVCSVPEGNEDAVYLVVVRETETGKHRYIERMTSRVRYGGAVVDETPEVVQPPDFICVDSALQYFGAPVQLIAGLDHLEGKDVWVVGEGFDPMGPFTVDGGEIDLGDVLAGNVDTNFGKKLLCYVGLLFTPQLETLDIAGGDGVGRIRKKTVARVGLEVDQSIGLRIGQSLTDNLDDWIQRDVETGFDAVQPSTELIDVPVESTWDQSARAALEQALPLPVTVIGLTREVAYGE